MKRFSTPLFLARSRFTSGRNRLTHTAANAALSFVVLCVLNLTSANAAGPRVLPVGELPNDARLGPLKDYDGYFPFTPPKSLREWNRRAEQVRRRILVSQGLWPMPSKTPLNAIVHGKVERDGYSVERVFFESFPGLFVTGSLYRPVGKSGKHPVVLCPHGHWPNGRFTDKGLDGVRREIVDGAERFEEGGRSPLQARCMQLARMGCVVFHYDMLGYADSTQLSFDLVHRFAKQRPEMNTRENWGLFSTQAESHLQSVMGLQTWNSIRALDFVTELPDVDATRIGVTGASGGGTQTMLLGAIDPRPTVIFPAVMVSTAMQGGCTCENASCLRIETGNIEFAALFAPKPQGMSAANDWTKEMPTKGFPELQQLYGLYGAKDNVFLKATVHFGHNYNYVNRASMYSWFNKHLKLGFKEPVVEDDYRRLSVEEMTVWDDKHPKPEGGPDFERKLVRYWKEDSERQLAAAAPKDAASLPKFREVYGGGIDTVIGRGLPAAKDVEYDQTQKEDKGDFFQMAGLLRNKPRNEELPITFLYPKQWNGQVVVWIHPEGKAGLFDPTGAPKAELRQLLKFGASIVGVDLFYQGEFLGKESALEKTRRVKNEREFGGYTFGFNHSVLASRIHDVLTVITFVRHHELTPKRIDVVGIDGNSGLIVAGARAQAREVVHRAAINTLGFRFSQLLEMHDPNFIPGGSKYGDVPGLLAIAAPEQTLVAGEGDSAPILVKSAYQAASAAPNLPTTSAADSETLTQKTLAWLMQ